MDEESFWEYNYYCAVEWERPISLREDKCMEEQEASAETYRYQYQKQSHEWNADPSRQPKRSEYLFFVKKK